MDMKRVKIYLTALAGTVSAVSAAQAAGLIHIPSNVLHLVDIGAVWIGILGASPLGRLVFKNLDSNDIVPALAIDKDGKVHP